MTKLHGRPCWYELMTGEGGLEAAGTFYGDVFGWKFRDAGMEGFTYHLATSGGDMAAGAMEPPADAAGMPSFWMIYFAVENADKAVTDAEALGASVHRPPADIPDTGRFAILADPQGAAFGILEPAPMEGGGEGGSAFDQSQPGHGHWHELMTSDAEAGFAFYAGLLGWESVSVEDMGEMGPYRVFSHDGAPIGGVMGLGNAPMPAWLPYFGVAEVRPAMDRIKAAGGAIAHGPIEVPGGDVVAIAQDPRGAWFAIVGPKEG